MWNIARWPIAFGIVLLLFGLVYGLAPNAERRGWKWLSPGSLVAGVMWLALSGLFALYTSLLELVLEDVRRARRRHRAAALAELHAWAILFGAELNSELDRQADIHAAGGERAGLTRPSRRQS